MLQAAEDARAPTAEAALVPPCPPELGGTLHHPRTLADERCGSARSGCREGDAPRRNAGEARTRPCRGGSGGVTFLARPVFRRARARSEGAAGRRRLRLLAVRSGDGYPPHPLSPAGRRASDCLAGGGSPRAAAAVSRLAPGTAAGDRQLRRAAPGQGPARTHAPRAHRASARLRPCRLPARLWRRLL